MRIVLQGAPGSGKGTQATKLTDHYGILCISVGTMLRDAAQEDTGPGKQVKALLDLGQHVPDEIVCSVLKERLRKPDVRGGFLLVGFPRSAAQADALDEILEQLDLPLDLVLLLEGDHDQFMERLEGRQICQSCGTMYNIFTNPPRVEGVCDLCGGPVRRRAEDNEETISNRMRVYDHNAATLVQYYRLHGKLRQVPADAETEPVYQALLNVIDEYPPTVIETAPVVGSPVSIIRPVEPESTALSAEEVTEPVDEKSVVKGVAPEPTEIQSAKEKVVLGEEVTPNKRVTPKKKVAPKK